MSRRLLPLFGFGFCLVAMVTTTACAAKKTDEAADEPAAAPVMVATAQRGTISSLVIVEAVLYPLRQATVVPKISAPVQRFFVQRGDRVREGQLVAVLENRDLSASARESEQLYRQAQASYENTIAATMPEDLTRAKSDLNAARESLDASKSVYESRLKLYAQGALAQKLVEDAKVAMVQAQSTLTTAQQHLQSLETAGQVSQQKAAKAQVSAAEAHFQSAQAQLSYTEVRSPISGVVSDRPVNPGEMASPGSALVSVVDISRVVARANLPVEAAAMIRRGETAVLSGAGLSLNGKVTVISPAVDANTTTVQVWVEALNPDDKLKLGTTVHLSIAAGTVANALVIPPSALLRSDEGGEKVMLAGADSLAHERKVEVGIRNPDQVQITSGLEGGEKVITTGALGLDDKARIQIGEGGAKPDAEDEKK